MKVFVLLYLFMAVIASGNPQCLGFYSKEGRSLFEIHSSKNSREFLASRWDNIQKLISQVVNGRGTAFLVTPSEYAGLLSFAPHAQRRLQKYIDSKPRHRAAFLILPETANLVTTAQATTFADHPTRQVAFSTDRKWLVTNLRNLSEQPSQHLVVMSSGADAFTALHEVMHLEAYEALFNYAEKKGTAFVLRMDAFTVLSELQAYQLQFRLITKDASLSEKNASEVLSQDLKNQLAPTFFAMDEKTRLELQKVTGLDGQTVAAYKTYLTKGPDFNSWPEILSKLSLDIFKEYSP